MSRSLRKARGPQTEPQPLPVSPPRWWVLVVFLVIWSIVAFVFYRPSDGIINWYTTIVWTLPFGVGIIGLYGALISRKLIQQQPDPDSVAMVDAPIHVFITTIGAYRVLGALTRVVRSSAHFAAYFRHATIQIVTEEGCEAYNEIMELAQSAGVEVLVVPANYQTPNGTRFKARAAVYSLQQLVQQLGGRDKIPADHWTYRLDDDTSIERCTVASLAAFVTANPGSNIRSCHLAQGILAYKLAQASNIWMWMADAIRTFDDLARFPTTTATGTPRAGLHGENMLVRTIAEEMIGWDFGPNEIVEDSRFALLFAEKFPGQSAWITARCFGAPPTTSADFGKQRGRWAEGMMALALDRRLPLRERLLVLHNMIVWSTGIFQPVLVVAGVSFMVGDFNVAPVTPWLAPLWVVSVGYTYWAYWEGMRQNARASGRKAPAIWQRVLLIPGIAWFSLLEGAGGTYGSLRHFLRRDKTFDGIQKPI